MSRTRESDYALGAQNEAECLSSISAYLRTDMELNPNMYGEMDYHNSDRTIWAEVKRRYCSHDRFDTIIIGKNKVDFLKNNPASRGTFFWKFNDGLYCVEYNNEAFERYTMDQFTRTDRGDSPSLVYYIPTSDLRQVL